MCRICFENMLTLSARRALTIQLWRFMHFITIQNKCQHLIRRQTCLSCLRKRKKKQRRCGQVTNSGNQLYKVQSKKTAWLVENARRNPRRIKAQTRHERYLHCKLSYTYSSNKAKDLFTQCSSSDSIWALLLLPSLNCVSMTSNAMSVCNLINFAERRRARRKQKLWTWSQKPFGVPALQTTFCW